MLRKLVDGNRADWEDRLGSALWAMRTNTSTVTGYSPFLLHHARPARAPVNDMLSGDPEFTFQNRLALQSEMFQKAAQATKDSRQYNKARIDSKANTQNIEVGDHVILKANEPLSLTAKWDFGYLVTKVNGLVLDLLHTETGAKLQVHREKVVLVDPDMAWENINPRPRRQRIKQPRVVHRRDSLPRNRADDGEVQAPAVIIQRPAHTRHAIHRTAVPHSTVHQPMSPAPPVTSVPATTTSADHSTDARYNVQPGSSAATMLPDKRPRSDSAGAQTEPVAKRTRLQAAKRAATSEGYNPAKRWRQDQLGCLYFVSYFFAQPVQNL